MIFKNRIYVQMNAINPFRVIVICLSDKLWYCRLSPNHKVLHYGDVEDGETPSIEALQEKSE